MINAVLWAGMLKHKPSGDLGAGLAEYALLLFVVAMAGAAILAGFGGMVIDIFSDATTELPTPTTAGP
ncbi:MAG: hypothetical protein ACR2QO_10570 [Acidimicrobiales bacterium]